MPTSVGINVVTSFLTWVCNTQTSTIKLLELDSIRVTKSSEAWKYSYSKTLDWSDDRSHALCYSLVPTEQELNGVDSNHCWAVYSKI